MIDITETRLATAALSAAQARLSMAAEVGGIASWERNLETGEGRWDPLLFRFFGLEHDVVFDRRRIGHLGQVDLLAAEWAAELQRKEQDRPDAESDEDADPEVDRGTIHTAPRNMKAVMTKSSARMASEEITTVRVVAVDTPSAVGFES